MRRDYPDCNVYSLTTEVWHWEYRQDETVVFDAATDTLVGASRSCDLDCSGMGSAECNMVPSSETWGSSTNLHAAGGLEVCGEPTNETILHSCCGGSGYCDSWGLGGAGGSGGPSAAEAAAAGAARTIVYRATIRSRAPRCTNS